MKFALIQNGIVGNFVFDIDPPDFPDLHLVDITEQPHVLIGDLYDEVADQFSHPAPPPVDPDAEREAFKAQRALAVAAIRVTVNEMEFDGDERSQGRMARAILAMQAAGVESTPWALADNTVAMVSLPDMQQALIAAGLAQTALWMPPE